MKRIFFIPLALAFALDSRAALTVRETKDGFDVLRNGVAVATGFKPILDKEVKYERSESKAADGSKAWNFWNKDKDDNFRFEIVERADGAVEVSILGYTITGAKNRRRALSFGMPAETFAGKRYDSKIKYRLYPQKAFRRYLRSSGCCRCRRMW